jgi:hypothetical protein
LNLHYRSCKILESQVCRNGRAFAATRELRLASDLRHLGPDACVMRDGDLYIKTEACRGEWLIRFAY